MCLPRQSAFLLALYFSLPLFGQDMFRIDSLVTHLQVEDVDSIRGRIMIEIAAELYPTDTLLALDYLEKGKRIASELPDADVLGAYFQVLGKLKSYYGYYHEAFLCFDEALRLFSSSGHRSGYFETLKEKGNVFLRTSQYDQAMELYNRALEYYRKSDNQLGMSRCLNNLGIIHKNRGEYVEALSLYQESILHLNSQRHAVDISQGYLNMGNVFVLLGSYDRALENYELAMELAESSHDTKTLALCLSNAGVVQNKCHNYSEAHDLYERALKVSMSVNDKVQISNCLINIGTNKADMGEPEEGMGYVKRGLRIKEELEDLRTISNCYIHMAEIHTLMDELDEALVLFRQALPDKESLGDQEGLVRCYLGIAGVELQKGRYEEAGIHANRALMLAGQINALEHIVKCYQLKMEMAEALGDFPSAYQNAKLYNAYRDSLLNEATTKAAWEMEFRTRSRALKQENENLRIQTRLSGELMRKRNAFLYSLLGIAALLSAGLLLVGYFLRRLRHYSTTLEEKNLVITKQNLKLDHMNRTKDRMMSIIAHDLRGTIGNQLMAVEVLNRTESQADPEIDRGKLLRNLKHSASYSLELLENLLHWSRLEEYESFYHPEEVKVDNLVLNCITLFSETAAHKELTFRKEIPGTLTFRADRIMLETIIRNLISNAIKFSHPKSTIDILVQKEEESLKIKVTDHGIGMSQDELDKILNNSGFTKRGTSNEKGAGIGLTLVREFASIHGGDLHVESTPGSGSSFEVTLPAGN